MDTKFRPLRGSRMLLEVSRTINAQDLLCAAGAKFAAHDRSFDSTSGWTLRYPDGSPVEKLPENSEEFTLDKYRDQLMKDYNKIVLYVAPGM